MATSRFSRRQNSSSNSPAFHLGKKATIGGSGAVVGAIVAGPVGAILGATLGTAIGAAAEAKVAKENAGTPPSASTKQAKAKPKLQKPRASRGRIAASRKKRAGRHAPRRKT